MFVIGNTIRKVVVTVMIGNYIHGVIVLEGSLFSRVWYRDGSKKNGCPIMYLYKVIFSKLCPRLSHKLLWTIPVILKCFQQ